MPEALTPRAIIKSLLRGDAPPRPLLMPIIFSLGSKVENLPLPQFLCNATKITSALRQIRSVLQVDGLTCYFDPLLEAEALGCKVAWSAQGVPALEKPATGSLREHLKPPESLPQQGRIPMACEVIRRLRAILKDEPALMVGVTGPFALAAQLRASHAAANPTPLPAEDVEFAAEVVLSVSKAYLEAGTDVILLAEECAGEPTAETCEWWASLIEPAGNLIRFYEALPVLLLKDATRLSGAFSAILDNTQSWFLCPALEQDEPKCRNLISSRSGTMGLALPPAFFEGGQAATSIYRNLLDSNPVLLTSSTDISANADPKQVATALECLRRATAA
jgi:Uroporphyrinogen decarboxylase (URO-D)